MSESLGADDAKLITLARSARARNGTPEGAAVRDDTGRTYVATSVSMPSLQLSAVQAAVVIAVASGASALEAVALVTGAASFAASDQSVVADLGKPTLLLADLDGVAR
jgi:hypothetical protein